MGDLEVVGHAAGFFHRAVDKRLLFFRQARFRVAVQLVPVRRTAEQIAFPPGGARVDRFLLGGGHRRHHLAEGAQRRRGEQRATHRGKVQRQQHDRQRQQQPEAPQADRAHGGGVRHQDQAAEGKVHSVVEHHAEESQENDDTKNHHKKLRSSKRSDLLCVCNRF